MPTIIFLIRHAEKLNWIDNLPPNDQLKKNYIDNHLLSNKGYERAAALVPYFYNRPEILSLLSNHNLACICAQDVDNSKDPWGRSERPRETIWPLLQYQPDSKLNHINSPLELKLFTKNQLNSLISLIKSGQYNGKSIIISWSHQQIPEIAKALGVPSDQVPRKWKKDRFDVTWVIHANQPVPTLLQLPQLLLYGDSPSVIDL
ncbi:hypothetical protein BC833DRAFT_616314 [Globomyces pollinis-pini]|nr:hypothetical protein BC833DRAFT_616314 [Globomyces pollinis-pini]